MKTWVSDTFPFDKLECQYFNICKDYVPKKCDYTNPCKLRQWFNEVIESYIPNKNLEFQIKLILEDRKK